MKTRTLNHELEMNQRAQNHELEMNRINQIGAATLISIIMGKEPTELEEYLRAFSEAVNKKVNNPVRTDGDDQDEKKRNLLIDFVKALPHV